MAHSPTPSSITDQTLNSNLTHRLTNDPPIAVDLAGPIGIFGPGRSGTFAISTVMNQPSNPSAASSAFTAIRSSIPNNLKPSALSSFVPLAPKSRSTVLTAPHKRSAPPPLKLSEPPKVTMADFEPYLHQIQNEWQRWEKNLNVGSGGKAKLQPSAKVGDPGGSEPHNPNPLPSRSKSRTPLSLDTVPSVFFDPNFSLANPSTFDVVTERSSPSKDESLNLTSIKVPSQQPDLVSIPDLATDQILHEKLSHYLDIVELNLVEEISRRSSSFFSALGNLQSLHAQTASCVTQVNALSEELEELRSTVAQRGLDIIQCGKKRKNLIKIEQVLLKVGEVWRSVQDVEEMVQGGDWVAALGLIESLESLWKTPGLDLPFSQPPIDHALASSATCPDRPLIKSTFHFRPKKIKALAALPSRLSGFRTLISKSLESELVSILMHDLKANVQDFRANGGQGWERNEPKSPSHLSASTLSETAAQSRGRLQAKERLKDRVQVTFLGLIRASDFERALVLWKERVMEEVKAIIETTFSDVSGVGLEKRGGSVGLNGKTLDLSRDVKVLTHPEFLRMAQETYLCLLGCIEGIDTQAQALLEVCGGVDFQNHSKSSQAPPAEHSSSLPSSPPLPEIVANEVQLRDNALEPSELSTSAPVDRENLNLRLTDLIQATAELANLAFCG